MECEDSDICPQPGQKRIQMEKLIHEQLSGRGIAE